MIEPELKPAPPRIRAEVLVLEDEPSFREVLVRLLEEHGFGVEAAPSVARARGLLASRAFDVGLFDVRVGDGSGLELIQPLRESAGAAQFVIMSAFLDPTTVAEATRRGAFEFVEKPIDGPRLVAVLERAAERARLLRENASLRSHASGDAALLPIERLGKAMQEVSALVARVAPLDVPVLITGESGTGKEFVARAIHAASPRARASWMPVNCGAFRPELIDSELFGHEKGAYTGATDRRLGLVEVARGGTLLLDEVGELPPDSQVSLLRFIEQGEYRRVGGTRILTSNVRILAATNRDLGRAVEAGTFRDDLYFRLAVVSIQVPPLRERLEDVPVFVEHFQRLRGHTRPFPPEIVRTLQERAWPGNLRELRNVVDRIIIAGDSEAQVARALGDPGSGGGRARDLTLAELEREHITKVLGLHSWNRTKAAVALGINVRTLARKIKTYGLVPG